MVEKGTPDGKLARRMDRFEAFFRELDVNFETESELRKDYYLTFDNRTLRRQLTVFDFLRESNRIDTHSEEEIREAIELNTQRDMLLELVGWKQELLRKYYAQLLIHQSAYRNKGWTAERERFKSQTISDLLRSASLLLRSLPQTCVSAQSLTQEHCERFIASRPGWTCSLAGFIRYLNGHERLFQKLKLIRQEEHSNAYRYVLPPEKIIALRERWLAANDSELRNALVGLLMLDYARKAEDLRMLTWDMFDFSIDPPRIEFGRFPVEISRHVAPLLMRYKNATATGPNESSATRYLFPGSIPGRPMSAAGICALLRNFGVTASQMFSTSLAEFFRKGLDNEQVICKALGLSLRTARLYSAMLAPRVTEEARDMQLNK